MMWFNPARKLGISFTLLSVLLGVAPAGTAAAAPDKPASVGDAAPVAEIEASSAAPRADLCTQVGATAGWSGEILVLAVAVALAESGCRPDATGVNTDGTRDRGLWQINEFWHPDVNDACAYDAQCNANAAFRISSSGTNWQPWSTYNAGLHVSRMDEARESVTRLTTGPAPDRVNQTNGDGYADLVGVNANGKLFGYNNGSLVHEGGSPFGAQTWSLPNSDWSGVRHMAAGDINRDGYADLVSVMSDGSLEIFNNGSLVNEGGLPYVARTWKIAGSWQNVKHFAVADVTDDGFADIVAVDAAGALVVYANGSLVNEGGQPFGGETWRFANWGAIRNLVLTDVNHDGASDIVAVDGNGELFGYHNGIRVNPDGVPFGGQTWRIAGSDWRGIVHLTAGDVNRDGYGDLIATKPDGSLEVYNNGSLVNAGGLPYAGRTWLYQGQWNTVRNIA